VVVGVVDGSIDGAWEEGAVCIVTGVLIGVAVGVQAAAVNPTTSMNITPRMRILEEQNVAPTKALPKSTTPDWMMVSMRILGTQIMV
jgi:hypothetical protein